MTQTNPPQSNSHSSLDPNPEILQRNLNAIRARSPIAAAQIEAASSSTNIQFLQAPGGELVGILDGRAMCSKRKPIDEATTWAKQHDPKQAGFYGVLGFGIGHHLQALTALHKKLSVVLCFEPDTALLKAVLERVDHSQWISESLFLLTTTPEDAVEISQLITGSEAFLTTGVELAPHPPSTKRLGQQGTQFSSTLLDVIKSSRTHLVTVLSHSGFTLRNILMNAGAYAMGSGIKPLQDSCKGQTAILIAAGPSLQRNLHLLEDPEIRNRAVIIAVQTMLKPLLERGIKPHFVTALDHHEISKRFYEGLTAEDVQGIRLIAEPKANAAIINTFPGEILYTNELQLTKLLGEDLYNDMGTIEAGATVAHLNYYLAKYFGCSNIILIGQDLGFTDGQYYSAGASIHQVWSGELSEHRTLEMFEWERIARIKSLLRVKEDIHGRAIFTDEQMSTYIAQFESDFSNDTQHNNLRIINATQGGVNIAHTEVMTLQEALDECLGSKQIQLPDTATQQTDLQQTEAQKTKVCARLQHIARQLQNIERNSKRTIELIKKAQDTLQSSSQTNSQNNNRVDRYIKQMHAIRDQVLASHPSFDLVNFYNQKGGLNRFKVDRQIKLLDDLEPNEKTSKQLDRDINNVQWIQNSASEVHRLIKRSIGVINGTATPLTRDEFADEDPSFNITQPQHKRVEAVLFADPNTGPLGFDRDLSQPIFQEMNALELTICRLSQCKNIEGITIISPRPDQVRSIINLENNTLLNNTLQTNPVPVRIIQVDNPEEFDTRLKSIAKARIASSECWRGSIGSLSCYDEGLDPQSLLRVMKEHNIDACAIVGSDWAMVDPELVDRIVWRYKADPDHCHVPFSQAVPGIGCCVLDRQATESLVTASINASTLGSIGAMLGYIPIGPQADPIASPLCVGVETSIRDAGIRVVADSPIRHQAMQAVYQGLGQSALTISSQNLLHAYAQELNTLQTTGPNASPQRIELELTPDRTAKGVWSAMNNSHQPNTQINLDQAKAIFKEAQSLRPDCSILFAGRGDPLTRPDALSFLSLANQSGITHTELRTDLFDPHPSSQTIPSPQDLINTGVGVLSINILSNSNQGYQTMTGSAGFDPLLDNLQQLFNARGTNQGQFPTPWIVPRITRCQETCHEIQHFYDRWITVCGCAIIDPHPPYPPHQTPHPNDRIQPLPIPRQRATQLHTNTLRIQCDGQVVDHQQNPIGSINAFEQGVQKAYQAMLDHYANKAPSSVESKHTTRDQVTA